MPANMLREWEVTEIIKPEFFSQCLFQVRQATSIIVQIQKYTFGMVNLEVLFNYLSFGSHVKS